MTTRLSRQLAAEALGTAALVATVVGSGIMAERLTSDIALALLCNTLATSAALFVLITILAPLSGAHFNPVVSLIETIAGRLPLPHLVSFLAAQLLGAVLGTLLAHLMFGLPPFTFSEHVRTGPGQWLSETVASFGLVLTILLARRARPEQGPALVALYIGAGYWFTASTCFANPAVTLARTLTASFSGIRPIDFPPFVAAQVVGALLALGLALWLLPQTRSDTR